MVTNVQKTMERLRNIKATMVIKNARVVNVFTKEIVEQEVAVAGETIIGVGGHYDAPVIFDAKGRYLCPGLVDAHAHLESSMLAPKEYVRIASSHGTSMVVADLQGIVSVCGAEGVRYLLENTQDLPINIYFLFPDLVSPTTGKAVNHLFTADEVTKFVQSGKLIDWGEMRDAQSLASSHEEILKILNIRSGLQIDGQAPGLSGNTFNVFCVAGNDQNGKYPKYQDVLEKLRRGMYVQLRVGSEGLEEMEDIFRHIAKDKLPTERIMLCTDGKSAEDMCKHGHIDYILRRMVARGIDPIDAICMATINPIRAYRLNWHGVIAPGYVADMVLLEDLREFQTNVIFQKGKLHLTSSGRRYTVKESTCGAVRLNLRDPEKFMLPAHENMPVIRVTPGEILTDLEYRNVPAQNGFFKAENGMAKIAVMNRRATRTAPVVGILEGMPIKNGALATSVAYDTYNVVLAGDNDADMLLAAQTLEEIKSGYVVVKDGKVTAKLSLPVLGLMSDLPAKELIDAHRTLLMEAKKLIDMPLEGDPFKTLSFITLPVIPKVRMTELGLYNVCTKQYFVSEVNQGKQRRIP